MKTSTFIAIHYWGYNVGCHWRSKSRVAGQWTKVVDCFLPWNVQISWIQNWVTMQLKFGFWPFRIC